MSLDPNIINDIAIELGIKAAFVEKDWYSVQVLKAISAYTDESIASIFSGGTSLSKGHKLLMRFSEDLDFRARYKFTEPNRQNRRTRRIFREGIINAISDIKGVEPPGNMKIETGSNYFKFPLSYKQLYDMPESLRPELQIEFSFTQPRLTTNSRSIYSFVAQFTKLDAETDMFCLSPVETGADKFSALIWRVLKRNRSDEKDDPAMIRHLHDLCALKSIIYAYKNLFVETAHSSFDEDQKIQKRNTQQSLTESAMATFNMLHNDALYQVEYTQFVDAMSYADEDKSIRFDTALSFFNELIQFNMY